MSKEFLRKLPLYEDLAEEDLDRLYHMAEPVSVAAGQVLMQEGSPADAVYIALDGAFQVSKRSGQQEVLIATCGAGDVIGEVWLLDQATQSATVRALAPGRLLKISQDAFRQLLSSSPSAALAVLHTAMARLRNTESLLMQHEKLAALGTLSAGLAHELNNPASAVLRGADQLRSALADWQTAGLALQASGLDEQAVARVYALRSEIEARAAAPIHLAPLERSDREDQVRAWLEQHGIDDAWATAPALVDLGWDRDRLGALAGAFTTKQLPLLGRWLGSAALLFTMLGQVAVGAERIAQIVNAVKTYSHVDQEVPIQEVDIHETLENALIILAHKLKTGVTVRREYAADLPHIEAYAGELNRAWTNLIDNAIDAMDGRGELDLRTWAQDGHVAVEICDSGPGIPETIRSRIFDPFFTTKPPGSGTGLGLHLVYNIVVLRHHGQVSLSSRPGGTCFTVILPVKAAQAAPAGAPPPI